MYRFDKGVVGHNLKQDIVKWKNIKLVDVFVKIVMQYNTNLRTLKNIL